jgi:hypothetical protein
VEAWRLHIELIDTCSSVAHSFSGMLELPSETESHYWDDILAFVWAVRALLQVEKIRIYNSQTDCPN